MNMIPKTAFFAIFAVMTASCAFGFCMGAVMSKAKEADEDIDTDHPCDTCRYRDVSPKDEPCIDCGDDDLDRWEAMT